MDRPASRFEKPREFERMFYSAPSKLLRLLFRLRQQRPSFDVPGTIETLIENVEGQVLMKRLHDQTKKDPEEIRRLIRKKVDNAINESSEGENLTEKVRSHQETSEALDERRREVLQTWNRAGGRISDSETLLYGYLVFALGYSALFWGVQLGPVGLSNLAVWGAVAGVIYSGWVARQRARDADFPFPWHRWLLLGVSYLVVGFLAVFATRALASANFLTLILGFTVVFVWYLVHTRWLKPRFVSQQRQVKADLKQQEEGLNERLDKSRKQAEDILTLLISRARDQLERELDVVGADPWALKVPRSPVERPWRFLNERYVDFIDTPTVKELEQYLYTLDRGSIGVAGERGAGKTSLMYDLKRKIEPKAPGAKLPDRNSRSFLTIWISAPTAIDEREFLLSVLAKLATRVGARLSVNLFWPNFSPEEETRKADGRRRYTVAAPLGGAAAALVYLVFLWSFNLITVSWITVRWLGAIPFIALAPPLILWGSRWLEGHRDPEPLRRVRAEDRPFVHATHSLLEELWFEQKETRSSGVSVGAKGVGVSAGLSTQRGKRPFTLPRLVQMWDDYVTNVVTAPGVFEKVVVFIDEVDKIKEAAEIGRFMRILKTLFKPQKLFFIVSISEDAYEQFQARGVRKEQRNEFDSSFDQPFMVNRMLYQQTEDLLKKRIIGDPLPLPVVQMIWAISKGNARDSIRLARDVLQKHEEAALSRVTSALVRNYCLRPLLQQCYTTLRKKPVLQDGTDLFQTLETISNSIAEGSVKAREGLDDLDKFIQKEKKAVATGQVKIENSPVRELEQVRGDLYYLLTLCQTFDDFAGVDRFKKIEENGP